VTGVWLQSSAPRARPRRRLVCAPAAGGGASEFAGWRHEFPDDVEVLAVQLPGRENRILDAEVTRVDAIVEAIGDELSGIADDAGLALFGHCLGALVMFELAHWLRARGRRPPSLLVASAHPAPDRAAPPEGTPVHLRSDDEVLAIVGAEAGLAPEVLAEPELVELILPVLRADAETYATYVYRRRPPLDAGVLAVGGRADVVGEEDLRGWARETRGACTTRLFPGGHFYLRDHRPELTAAIRSAMGC
jgi:surfactin synthase thioesterase subunit